MEHKQFIPILESDLTIHSKLADAMIMNVEWELTDGIKKKVTETAGSTFSPQLRNAVKTASSGTSNKSIKDILDSKDPSVLMTEGASVVANAIRRGLQVGYAASKQYAIASGVEQLHEKKNQSATKTLTGADLDEYTSKNITTSAVCLYSFAKYVLEAISTYKPDEVSDVTLEFTKVPEVALIDIMSSTKCACFYYAWFLDESKHIKTDLQVVKFTQMYFKALLSEVLHRKTSLAYTEYFDENEYKLKEEEFILNGFKSYSPGYIQVKETITPFDYNDMVGNKRMIFSDVKQAQILAMYDPVVKSNPYFAISPEFPKFVAKGGIPGVGKTLSIRGIATLLRTYCETLGLKFFIRTMPKDMIDEYQGKTAKKMLQFFSVLKLDDRIILILIDDAGTSFPNRARKGSSTGSLSMVESLLTITEGSDSENKGNWMIQMLDNNLDMIDPAIRSRWMMKALMEGALTWQDFVDQMFLHYGDTAAMGSFFDIMKPEDYDLMSNQGIPQSIDESLIGKYEIESDVLRKLDKKYAAQYGPTSSKYYGHIWQDLRAGYESISNREMRNVLAITDMRSNNYLFPEVWFKDRSQFIEKPFSERENMLRTLRKEKNKGNLYSKYYKEETLRHLDLLLKIEDMQIERDAKDLVRQAKVRLKFEALAKDDIALSIDAGKKLDVGIESDSELDED